MTCIKVMPLYGYLKHKRLALLDLNPAVRDNRLILRVNFSFHAPRDAASGGQSARHRISSMSFYKENRENRKQINRKAA